MEKNVEIHPAILLLKSELINIRRQLHSIPELAFQEKKTSAFILSYLSKYDLEIVSEVGITGIVAILKGLYIFLT